MERPKIYLYYLLFLLFIVLPLNISASALNCNRNLNDGSDRIGLNLDQILAEFFTKKKNEFVQQIRRNENIKMGRIDSVSNFVFRLNFEEEIINFMISKKYDNTNRKFVDTTPDTSFADINMAVNNLMVDTKMPNIYFAELLFDIPVLWRTALDNKDAIEIITYLNNNLNTTNDKIKTVFVKHVKIFLDEFNDILINNNTNDNGTFLLGHMRFNGEIRDEYKKPAIERKLFTLVKYIRHGTPSNDYSNLLSCVKQDLMEKYETNKDAHARLSMYIQTVVDYVKGYIVCEGNNNGEGGLSFDCLPKDLNGGYTGIVEIDKGSISNCHNFFVEDKIRVFNDQEYDKIKNFGINTLGRLVYVTDHQNKKHFFGKSCSLNPDGIIKEYFSSSRLINFDLIQQQISADIPLSDGVSYSINMDQDYQTQTILSGINKDNYLIANLVTEVPCNSGIQVVFINDDQVYVKTLSSEDCDNISDFWANFNVNTPTSALIEHLLYEKREKTLTVDLSQRQLALDKLLIASYTFSARNHTLLKMIEAFYPNEYVQVVNKLELHGINNLFDEFKSAPYYHNNSSESLFELALVLSSIINGDDFPESKFTKEKAIDFMQNADNLLVLEGDLLKFENVNFEWLDGTTLRFIGDNLSKTISYKELMPVKISSTVKLGNVTLYPGTVEIMPALQVATFALENDKKIQETVGYVVLDFLGLFLGVTEANVAFKVGSVVRKIAITADIIGTSSNLAIQLINEDAIDPVLRNRIQIASAAMVGVGIFFSVIEIGKVVNDMSKIRAINKEVFKPDNLTKFDEIHKYYTDVCLESRGIQTRFSDEILSLSPDLKIADNLCDFECKLSTFGCFSGSTEVLTETGKKEMRTISKEDKVWTYNFTKKIKELKPIAGIKSYIVAAILSIVMSSGDTLWATPNHPIYTTSGYKEAAELSVGDTLWNYSGDYERIIGKSLIDTILQVYDLSVLDNHNYYVGEEGVLVHNNGECFLKNIGDNYITLASKIDALDDARKSEFLLDFFDASDDVLRMLDGNPGMVKAWEGLAGTDDWARLNINLLEKTSGESDEFIRNVGRFYKTTMKNNTPAGFNGAGVYGNGVFFNDLGFPDFKPFNPIGNQFIFPNAVGNRDVDFRAAKQWLKDKVEIEDYLDLSSDQLGGSPFKVKINGIWSEQMTWHHHENGKDLIPVLSDIHNTTKHVGGVKIVELG